jgi:conjugative transfer pilus assembly protein TraH
MRKLNLIILILLTILISPITYASVDGDLKYYFNQLGAAVNLTAPHAYEGQRAGYFTGGSLFARNQVRNIQIAHIDLPTYRSGCGGIDFYTGGISIINKEEFVNALQNILSSGGSYAMTLALEEMSPLIANVMKYWQQAANFINQANLNSCETAEALVGGLWPNTRAAHQRVCEDVGTGTGYFKDWAQARQGCGFENKNQEVASRGKADARYKDIVIDQGNLAWQAISKNNFLRSDTELSYLFMTLSGTIVIKNQGKSIVATPSGIKDKKLLKALLYGGDAEILYCTDSLEANGCLELGRKTIFIAKENGFQSKVKAMLDDMVYRMRNDEMLSPDEIGLISNTSLPILSMLRAQVAFNQLKSPINVSEYADIISLDILLQYLEESLSIVKISASLLSYPEEGLKKFNDGITDGEDAIKVLRKSAYEEVTKLTMMIEQTQFIEKMLAGALSTELSNNLSWAKSLRGQA